MEVYEFDKTPLDRLGESLSVLSWNEKVIPASQVRKEWAYYIELQIEPTGWQALWKIPRVICEELKIRFPTIVFGMVEQVLFKELRAVFIVEAVQDNDVHLPEKHEVALENLWPTLNQENTALNVERTAECLDRLRFFYTNVWMPWDKDNDDDLNWVEKHLESRIRFCYDLRKGSMKRALAAHIRTLITEAKYIQQRQEYLELDLSDDETLEDTLDKTQITDLMKLHLRLAMIRSEVEMLENPELRRIYEDVKFGNEMHSNDAGNTICTLEQIKKPRMNYIVTMPSTLERQMNLMRMAEQLVAKSDLVQMCPSLQEVLNICNAYDNIYLSPGKHAIKFLEYLNGNGSIIGLTEPEAAVKEMAKMSAQQKPVIMSPDDDSILLVVDGNFTLTNLVLDCQNIRTGISVKSGKLCLKDCRIIGDGKSSTQQGIVCYGGAELMLERCSIENFATGITVNEKSCISVKTTEIWGCQIGIELNANHTKVHFENSRIYNAKRCGIYVDTMVFNIKSGGNWMIFDNWKMLRDLNNPTAIYRAKNPTSTWTGKCDFIDCKANIYVLNKTETLISEKALKSIYGDDTSSPPKEDIEPALDKKIVL